MRNFFKEIPIEMKELAIIDGTDDVTTLINCSPLSKPMIAIMCLFYSVSYRNIRFGAAIYFSRIKH